MLRKFDSNTQQINVFAKNSDGVNAISDKQKLNLFGASSPTIGEINYSAFGVISEEFHDELYGFIQARAIDEDERYYREKDFDQWLINQGVSQDRDYSRLLRDRSIRKEVKTLPTLIRNIIHHPENENNSYTAEELEESIELLLGIVKTFE